MGAELITIDWTTEGRPNKVAVETAVSALSDEMLDQLLDSAQTLAMCETLDDVREVLLSGATEYLASVEDNHRYVTARQIRDDLWHYTAGGQSWGDDPFDGWSDLCAFLDACDADESLGITAGFVSWGIYAETAKEADILSMVALAMAAEDIPEDKTERIITKVAKALGIKEA